MKLTRAAPFAPPPQVPGAPPPKPSEEQQRAIAAALAGVQRAAAERGPVRLSVVMPYYKRLADLRRVLPLQLRYLARPDLEVVLALDEPSEERDVLELLRAHPEVKWRVVINDHDHPWRPPCCAINAGIKNAVGELVLVVSPESAFAGDVPGEALAAHAQQPTGAIAGRVVFATFAELAHGSALQIFRKHHARGHRYYGSICAPRASFAAVGGYDESFAHWGGDDDNLRFRLQLLGVPLFTDDDLCVLHLSDKPRGGPWGHRNPDRTTEPQQKKRAFAPVTPFVNPGGWGVSFGRVALDWRR